MLCYAFPLEQPREAPRRSEAGAVAGSLQIPSGALAALQPQLDAAAAEEEEAAAAAAAAAGGGGAPVANGTSTAGASVVLSHVVYGVDLHATSAAESRMGTELTSIPLLSCLLLYPSLLSSSPLLSSLLSPSLLFSSSPQAPNCTRLS